MTNFYIKDVVTRMFYELADLIDEATDKKIMVKQIIEFSDGIRDDGEFTLRSI